MGRRVAQRVVQRALQGEAVAEPGQRVRARLHAGRDQVGAALAVRERQADQHRDQRGGRQDDGEQVDGVEVVVDEQREAGEGEHGGRDDVGQLVAGGAPAHGRLPGGDAHHQPGHEPSDVEQRVADVGVLGDLQQVDGVGDGERGDPGAEPQPAAVQSAAPGGHGADDAGQQDHVAQRIGQVRRHGGGVAAGGHLQGAEDERGAERAGGQRGHDPVEPQARVQVRHPLANEQHDADVEGRADEEPAGIGHRGVRRGVDVGVGELPVDVSGGVEREGDADHRPGRPLAATYGHAHEAEHRGRDEHGVVEHLERRRGQVHPRRAVLDGQHRGDGDQDPEEHARGHGHRAPRHEAEHGPAGARG